MTQNRFDRREAIITTEADAIRYQVMIFERSLRQSKEDCEIALQQYDKVHESDQNKQDWIDLHEFYCNFFGRADELIEFFKDEVEITIRKALIETRAPKIPT